MYPCFVNVKVRRVCSQTGSHKLSITREWVTLDHSGKVILNAVTDIYKILSTDVYKTNMYIDPKALAIYSYQSKFDDNPWQKWTVIMAQEGTTLR